ncbi:Transcriptional regulator, MarR family [Methylophaga frappieri]|uniref:Transcriptional regulator, MarR family n=1 Tax=Methylophaga frappieri (strain ATCC BAA-2434 / DSM 25690 / JAM7) TaxID=754477 RepID=I1YHI8_METFJ|nr:MarR family transcriptional regulator [Methylophaga frappieri]AFJ02381.1 Transcriptional regulator, MarR family [Methylophaga frappieri]
MSDKIAPIESIIERMKANLPADNLPAAATVKRLYWAREQLFSMSKQVMEKNTLSAGEYDALGSLRVQGSPFELTPSDICQNNMLSSGGLTKVLNNLEKRGLISRHACHEDQRSRKVRLTQAGQNLIESALSEVFADYETRLAKTLSASERQQLDNLLGKLNQPGNE